ncbi:MAG TPA: copper chaperone PCu(A)C [Rhodocyclaceae bacterium]|nr:copper chaperone PCu(A)C [Rhodocyclaceae bacterium]
MLKSSTLRRCALIACLLAAPAWAQTVEVSRPWVRGTVTGQTATGAFMELKSPVDATLVGVSSPVSKLAQIHRMVMDKNVMKMQAIPSLDLPAGKTVLLEPGSYHIMLTGLTRQLKKGETVPLTLKIETKDKKLVSVAVKAEVLALTAMPM